MSKVVWRPDADRDLDEIWLYIARDNPSAASNLLREIAKTSLLYARNPGMGTPRNYLMPKLRSFTVGMYMAFYLPIDGEGVEIIRVLHSMRDLEALL